MRNLYVRLPASWETCMWVKKQQLEPCMELLIGSEFRKEYDRAVCCHCFFNLSMEHIIWNAKLNEWQARIKIGGRNINNLRDGDDNILVAESKEALKNLLMRVKEKSEKASLKLNIKEKK